MKKHKWVWGFSLALTLFTVFISLDTFVLASPCRTAVSIAEESQTSEDADQDLSGRNAEENTVVNGTSGELNGAYDDGNININIREYTVNDTQVYAADVRLSSAEYLKTALADDTYGKNVTEKTSEIAEANGAVLAINGDYYGARETGYVIRNGVIYRDTSEDEEVLCIYEDGNMDIVNSGEVTAEELLNQGVAQAFSFGPGLVEDGQVTVSAEDEVGRSKSSNPRTAIGIADDLHYIFVVSDGRTEESEGLSLSELAEFLRELGAETAYNLDGGGSSAMVFEGNVINQPTTSGRSIKERKVSDIVYIG